MWGTLHMMWNTLVKVQDILLVPNSYLYKMIVHIMHKLT